MTSTDERLRILTSACAGLYAACLALFPDEDSRAEWEHSQLLPLAAEYLADIKGDPHD